MDRRFLRYYEQELRFVRDLAGEFASAHSRVANRFGLDQDACADPYVEWLLDGFAFLAARVHQKLDAEHEQLAHHLMEMVYPNLLAPTPAAAIVRFRPEPNPAIVEQGFLVPRGTRLASRAGQGDATRCTFTTAHPLVLWPLELAGADYLARATLAAAGLPDVTGARAALRIRLRTLGEFPLDMLRLDRLVLHLAGGDRIAHRLYEAILAHGIRVVSRQADGPDALVLGKESIRRAGLSDDEALLPPSPRGFSGYRLLREYFTLPERFLFIELTGLLAGIRRCPAREIDLFVLLDAVDPVLEGAIGPDQIALFATPAVNLFERRAKPITVTPHERDFHVVGDRLRPIDHEVFDVLEVEGVGSDERERLRFERFYHTSHLSDPGRDRAFYAIERRPRLVSGGERRRGGSRSAAGADIARSSYVGSEVFLTLVDGTAAPWPDRLQRLDVLALCTNRDLPLALPLPPGESHFTSEVGGPVARIQVLGGIASPRESLAVADDAETGPHGMVSWRLAGHLALSHLSLLDAPDGQGALALRALLRLYSGQAGPGLARQVDGVLSVRAAPVTRRLPGGGPITFGRGLEVALQLAESAFPEGSAFLLGSVLESFFRRYVALNSFTETVVGSVERGDLIRWPARIGQRHLA
jgi:type VI secretion system protein ImpG